MKNIIERIKPILKVAGVIVGIFILWLVFNAITNNRPPLYNMQKNLSSASPMTNGAGMNFGSDYMESDMGIEMMRDEKAAYSPMMAEVSSLELPFPEKKVIKNGDLSLKVENTEKAAEEISEIVRNQAGEVFSTNFYERIKGQKSGTLTVKVPVEKFEETLAQIKKIATQVVSESTTGQDVTEQYSDLQVQIKNKRAEEQSFVKILDQAQKIEDVLAVTQQISRVRNEIERLEGQIRFMDSQTDLSTIVIDLSEDIEIAPIQNDWRPWQVAKKSFSDLINNIQDFADGVIRFIIVGIPSLIPFLLFLGIIYWIGKKVWQKIQK